MRSTVRLFNGIPVKDGIECSDDIGARSDILEKTIPHGFILSPLILASYPDKEIERIIDMVKDEIGLSGSQMNASFHKSWEKVEKADICQLVAEQILHYITTYGYEAIGIYSKDTVYVPKEDLDIPSLEDNLSLTVIKGYTHEELMDKLMTILGSGIALKEETQKDVLEVAIYLDIDDTQISAVKNKEVRAMLYDHLDKFPLDPQEFLRYAIYKATDKTLIIKNKALCDAIKASNGLKIVKLFKTYDKEVGFATLAKIFNRYKPLFLAFKNNAKMNQYINKIGHLSKTRHEPMKDDYLNNVTALLLKKTPELSPLMQRNYTFKIRQTKLWFGGVELGKLQKHLERASLFRKARLAYALNFRKANPESILYKVRNGKAYAKEYTFPNPALVQPVLDIVMDSIAGDLKGVEGKKIYIPNSIVYALPTTEKQFTGNIPSGSFVDIGEDAIIGIHWKNAEPSPDAEQVGQWRRRLVGARAVNNGRVDIDLSLVNQTQKLGWNATWRTEKRDILYSGDVVDAPGEGASEMYYIKKGTMACYVVSVNLYAGESGTPFDLFFASEPVKNDDDFMTQKGKNGEPIKSYMVDPNNIVCKTKSTIEDRNRVLGLVIMEEGRTRFFFSETGMGNARVSSRNNSTIHAFNYLVKFMSNPISLNEILERAGAVIVNDAEEKEDCDIDLSLESIDKATLLEILA